MGTVVSMVAAIAVVIAWARSDSAVDTLGLRYVWSDPLKPQGSASYEFGLVSARGQLRLVWQVTRHDLGIQLFVGDALNGNGWAAVPVSRYFDDYNVTLLGPPGLNAWPGPKKFGLRTHADDNRLRAIGFRGWQLGAPHSFWILIAVTAGALFGHRWRTAHRAASMGLCRRCGYDLRGTRDRCPECGAIYKAVDVIDAGIEDRGRHPRLCWGPSRLPL